MEPMASPILNGNMDWMGLAAKMLSSLKETPSKGATLEPKKRKKKIQNKISPTTKPRLASKPTGQFGYGHHRVSPSPQSNFAATVHQFEFIRLQLLRQLVIYQKQLLALKIPLLPQQHRDNKRSVPNSLPPQPNNCPLAQYQNKYRSKQCHCRSISETNHHMKKNTKKTVKKNRKGIQVSYISNKPVGMLNTADEINNYSYSTSQKLTEVMLPNNNNDPINEFGFNDVSVCTQYSIDNNRQSRQNNKKGKNKIVPSKLLVTRRVMPLLEGQDAAPNCIKDQVSYHGTTQRATHFKPTRSIVL